MYWHVDMFLESKNVNSLIHDPEAIATVQFTCAAARERVCALAAVV